MNWHDYFTYDAETGHLIWKERSKMDGERDHVHRVFNKKYAGRVAGTYKLRIDEREKYLFFCIKRIPYVAHRVIWEMHHGPIPDGMLIDHINGIKRDNRITNLRLATHRQNCQNRCRKTKSASGFRGVGKVYNRPGWRASIRVNGIAVFIGYFPSMDMAVAARLEAEAKYFGEHRGYD